MSSRCRVLRGTAACHWYALSLAVLVGLLAASGPAGWAQQPSGWEEPTNLSRSSTASYYPDVAVDPAGRVYVVWGEYSEVFDGRPDMLMLRIKEGEVWSAANDIAVGGHLPQIAADSRGRLHLVRVANGLAYKRAWVGEDPLNAQNWTSDHALAGTDAYWPDLAVDSRDRVHVVFSGEEGIQYVRSVDGGDSWTEPVRISLHSDATDTPRLALDSEGSVYAVWQILGATYREQDPIARAIGFSWSDDGGQTWQPPVEVISRAGGFEWPQVAVDSMGTRHVVWRSHEIQSIGYMQSNDGGLNWSPAEILDLPAGGAYSHDLAVDSADNLHLVIPMAWEELPLNPVHIVRTANGIWIDPVPVAQNPCEGASTDVEIVLEKGNHLHVVWYDVEECLLGWVPPSGRGEVFYSDSIADAPKIPSGPVRRGPLAGPTTATPGVTADALTEATNVSPSQEPSPTVPRVSRRESTGWPPGYGLAMGICIASVVLAAVAGSLLLRRGTRRR